MVKKAGAPCYYIPVNTHDTAGMGRGMPRCAKVHTRTRTRDTRFGNTAGFPVPVANPMDLGCLHGCINKTFNATNHSMEDKFLGSQPTQI